MVYDMMKTRNMVGAFLESGDDILMLHRDGGKALEPNKWTGVGGHIEADELNDPLAACLREIEEETGISRSNIRDLKLRYITINHKQDEIRIAFYFFGRLMEPERIITTRDGIMQWTPRDMLLSHDLSNAVRHVFEHWLRFGNSEKIHVCTIDNEKAEVRIASI